METRKENTQTHAMTVDVEDYFHVAAFEQQFAPSSWSTLTPRVDKNTYALLDLFDQKDAKATFFMLGAVAEKFPELVKEIANRGHEVASHGYAHRRATEQSKQEFFADVQRSKQHLEDTIGQAILGYRAPSFSINESNEWAFEVLAELGFKYSSSTYPVKHDLYGVPDWPRFKYYRQEGIAELPIPTYFMFGKSIPIGGGGYYRLFPKFLSDYFIAKYIKTEKQPYSFYMHPWEIDPDQPRVAQASAKSKFRHYLNLDKMKPRLASLLEQYQWQAMKDVYNIEQE